MIKNFKEFLMGEKWKDSVELSDKDKGKFHGKSVEDLKSELEKLKVSGPYNKDSKEATYERQLIFAIRAKTGWGKVTEGTELYHELLKKIQDAKDGECKAIRAEVSKLFKSKKLTDKEFNDISVSLDNKMHTYTNEGVSVSKVELDINNIINYIESKIDNAPEDDKKAYEDIIMFLDKANKLLISK